MTQKPIIQFRNVVKSFDGIVVLDGLSFDVFEGETLCVVGGSGTGKSVTLKVLLGLLPIDEGEIYFQGQKISDLEDNALGKIRRQFGMVFQGAALFDSLSVYENIAYPLQDIGLSDKQIDEMVHQKLAVVGLEKAIDLYPADLSGGMKKRIGLARALAPNPKVILYDEPTAGLDPANVNRIDELIQSLQQKFSVTSMLVTHNMESVFKVADRVVFLHNKRAEFIGTLEQFRQSGNDLVQGFIAGKVGKE